MPHLVDSNVFLRVIDDQSPLKLTARSAILRLRGRGEQLTVAPQSIAEIWNTMTRPQSARGGMGMSITEAEHKVTLLEKYIAVQPDPPGLYALWRQLIIAPGVHGVQVHDARLAAFCGAAGISHLLTFNDKDFLRYAPYLTGLTVVHPAAI